jgi:hypothetical protein
MWWLTINETECKIVVPLAVLVPPNTLSVSRRVDNGGDTA